MGCLCFYPFMCHNIFKCFLIHTQNDRKMHRGWITTNNTKNKWKFTDFYCFCTNIIKCEEDWPKVPASTMTGESQRIAKWNTKEMKVLGKSGYKSLQIRCYLTFLPETTDIIKKWSRPVAGWWSDVILWVEKMFGDQLSSNQKKVRPMKPHLFEAKPVYLYHCQGEVLWLPVWSSVRIESSSKQVCSPVRGKPVSVCSKYNKVSTCCILYLHLWFNKISTAFY